MAEERGQNNEQAAPAYSLFGKLEKRYIVVLVAFAGWFSTLSSFIYYPVIHIIAKDLNVSVNKINLTVTSYMVVSSFAPALVGDAADMLGRRPIYLITLTVYLISNMSIALQNSFAALLCLRMLQSAGISGSFSCAYGVVSDLSTPSERGSYISALSFGITTAPGCIGPILGGAIGYAAGWRWIFWFLCISSGACLITMLLSLPETARGLVGNGSVAPPKLLQLPFGNILCPWKLTVNEHEPARPERHVPNPLKSLRILMRTDTAIVVVAGGITYTIYVCIHASLSTMFITVYGLNQWQAGLVYLPFGIGGTLASLFSGKLLDRDYEKTARRFGRPIDKVRGDNLATFPIEEARLRNVLLPSCMCVVSVVAFGWVCERKLHIAVPLVFLFVAGVAILTCFNIHNTLLVDINHKAPSAAQASNNIVRCALAAIMVAFLQDMIESIGIGWTFTILGSSNALSTLLYLKDRSSGMAWRTAGQEIEMQST